jgi:hypothetical protein
MDVHHDRGFDPNDLAGSMCAGMEPVRRGKVAAALAIFLWAMALSLIGALFGAVTLVSWILGILVGLSAAGVVVAWIES